MRSIYAQWVKPWSVGDFAFDTTSSYDELTIGAADSGRLIREGNTERRCLIFCDSPGLHTRSGTSYRERIDEYVTNILEVRADDDGYSRRAFYDGEQRVITQLNREKTELMIGYPRFYKGCYYTECADPQNPDDLRRFGIACFWAFRPTLYISSIFYDFEPDPAGDSWSAGRIRGFYRKKPIVENGAIPWADPKRYRIRVGGTFWPAGTQSWDPALEAEPERAPGRWPNVFSWTSED